MYFKHLEQVTSPRVACALVPIPTVKLSSVTLAERQQPLKKLSFSTDSKSKSAAMRREQTIRHESETRPPRAAHRNHRRRPAEAASGKTMAFCKGTEPGCCRRCCYSGHFFRSGAASIVRVNVKYFPQWETCFRFDPTGFGQSSVKTPQRSPLAANMWLPCIVALQSDWSV